MSSPADRTARVVVTAFVTGSTVLVARNIGQCTALVDEILALDHTDQETDMWVGDVQFHVDKDGPFPNHRMRVSALPSAGCAALNYTDHDDPTMSLVNSYNPTPSFEGVYLIFNGETGDVFPQWAVIPIADARAALLEWVRTRALPNCIEWRPFGHKEA